MSRRHHSPFGWLVVALVNRRVTARAVLAQYFEGSALRAPLTRAIKHGSLVTGELCGPVYESDGRTYRPPSRRPEDDFNRSLDSLAAARFLAAWLCIAERVDPRTRKASGSALWQGHTARRLRLTARRGKPRRDGTRSAPGGVREVQRYHRPLEAAGAFESHQPNAANVPDAMRARPNAAGDQWAFNVYVVPPLPVALQQSLRRWRGEAPLVIPPRAPTSSAEQIEMPAHELATQSAALARSLSTRGVPRAT